MGVKQTGFTELKATLTQGGEKVRRAVRERIRREGLNIEAVARAMAPRENMDLEEAIQSFQGYDSERNGRLMMEVGIVDEGRVGNYAVEMHEGLQPFGDGGRLNYNLGPGSVEKQMGQSEIVGGKFLERALQAREKELIPEITVILQKEFD